MKITVGKIAPDFTLPDQNGTSRTLSDSRGAWTVLYFYPKDDTPGCTKEACMITEAWPNFKKLKVQVFGVSIDPVKKHKKFALKYDLPFTLLADDEKKVVHMYNVWAKKKFMGREYMGTLRTTFLIDPSGRIAKMYEAVKPELHADELLTDLKEFQKKTGK